MTQQEIRVLKRLERGPITQLEALNELGVMRLASRISALKQRGVAIKKQMIGVSNRFGDKCSVALYSLEC